MENSKSFYEFDYIIEMSEKRLEQYTSAYQLVIGRLTNIILVYSAIGIYLVPIIQDLFGEKPDYFIVEVCLLVPSLLVSLIYTIRLLIPVDIAYLRVSKQYFQHLRLEYEAKMIKEDMTVEEKTKCLEDVNKLLKASYIDELSDAQENNFRVFRKKSSFYYNALIWGLFAVIPYIFCIGYHITKKDEKVQKVEIINLKKV